MWLKHMMHIGMIKQLSKLLPILKELKLASFKEIISAKKIQYSWRKYLVLKGVKKLTLRQKFLVFYLGKKIKKKAKILKIKNSLKKIAKTVVFDSSVRKKMRLGLGRFRAKTKE